MIGSCESPFALGVIPCAISWLYRAVSEQKQKTGARFSIRVSAVEITAVSQQIRDLLTDYASGKWIISFSILIQRISCKFTVITSRFFQNKISTTHHV